MLLRKLSYSEACDEIASNIAAYRQLYHKQGLTAKVVAQRMGIAFDNNFQKALLREVGPKGLGLGGFRLGSGNKPGSNGRK